MISMDSIGIWLILLLMIQGTTGISFNQPQICSSATWNSTGITFANSSTVGTYPYGIFINNNNTVFVANQMSSLIQVWFEGNSAPRTINARSNSYPISIFVSITNDIYLNNNQDGVDKFVLNSPGNFTTLSIGGKCYDLFIDSNNSLYCSLYLSHKVIKRSLNSSDNQTRPVAGNGITGLSSEMLYNPSGIFVDSNFNLYVADSSNNRIQLFQPDQLNGTTIAGTGAPNTITLNQPSGVVLDTDGYLFIVDRNNHRIVGSGPTGFRCIIGCSGTPGTASSQLQYPQTMAFDSHGNIFVSDTYNHRIQKFILKPDSCVILYNQPKLCPFASWNSTGMTFANSSIIGSQPNDIFIDATNAIYVSSKNPGIVRMWPVGSTNPTRILTSNLDEPHGIFVTGNGDIYVDNGKNSQVVKWTVNSTNNITVSNITSICFSLFVDINNTLYCSLEDKHQVVKIYLDNNSANMFIVAAGTGAAGSASNMLYSPKGIFVNTNFSLYVADCGNNRIQLFPSGQSSGTTIVGDNSSSTLTLNCPTGIILDADNHLFIADSNNHRIVRTGSGGVQCVVGCTNSAGSGLDQLNSPQSLAFDNNGNFFVVDRNNSRIQKFLLTNYSCDATATSAVSTISTSPTSSPASLTSDFITSSPVSTISTSPTFSPASLTDDVITSSPVSTIATISTIGITSITSTNSTAGTFLTHMSTAPSLPSNQSCWAPNIALIPSAPSSSSSPIQFRRSQDIYISSYVQLNCANSLLTITKWSIYNCNPTCHSLIQTKQIPDTTSSELFIPAKTLAYGTYRLTLTVSMASATRLSSSASINISIIPSNIKVNLVQFGATMITRGYQQDLILDPGTYSIDPDSVKFNPSNWEYRYYCRIYGRYDFPNLQGTLLTIDDTGSNSLNSSCLSNPSRALYNGIANAPRSSLTILANSLQPNQTYQFMVTMENLQSPFQQSTGYLLVQIEQTQRQLIVVACVISTLCTPNAEYQLINPTTQVALFSLCIGSCTIVSSITWNIYQGVINSSSNNNNSMQWDRFNQSANNWFFGLNTANFTATNALFLAYPSIEYWRFEVIYSWPTETGSSALSFRINQPPKNGACVINPLNGTTSTLFTIMCSNWQDQEGVQEYSFYSWTTNPAERTILAFSSVPTITLRLPAGNNNQSEVHLVAYIRDTMDGVTEFDIPSVIVMSDFEQISNLVDSLQKARTNNSIIQALASGNQNVVGQVISSVSREFNRINNETVEKAIANGIPASNIVVSPLGSQTQSMSSTSTNASALAEYNQQLNTYANIRDQLITYTTNLVISTPNSIRLQASSLVQLTQATNQLTRTTCILASDKCYQLASALYSMANKIPYEDVQTAATLIAQCANNVLNAINGPLQQRTIVLDLDSSRANTFPEDYDTDLESEWSHISSFADGNDFSSNTIEKNRNLYYQKQYANKISLQTSETLSLLTSALNIHLNLGQHFLINTSSVFMSIEPISNDSLSDKLIEQVGNAYIKIPANFQLNSSSASVTLRSMVQPLAPSDNAHRQSNTNLSRSISLSLYDHNGNEIPVRTNLTDPIEIMIPRDPNIVIPAMHFQNVTGLNSTPYQLLFNLHFVNITNSLPVSVHFEIHPLDITLGYLFIYKFDSSPILNSTVNQIDGWTLLCPSNLTNESLYTYFINNQQTVGHRSAIFGLRELNSSEIDDFCSNSSINTPPITNQPFNFTSDYELRIYTSGCYYLDSNNNWQSDGLIVGPLTNHYQTQCFSTHLTTFAGGFIVLPSPINWNYVFSHADFNQNKTIYITLIIICILYILLIIYARYKDRKDLEKLGVTPLPDNHKSDQYYYQILVFTGHRKAAGTKSKVHFIVSGDYADTQVRTLDDPHRKILQRGGIDAFIMAVPKSLGLLNYIHIWHDNSGEGASASWFLKYIIVRDLQTMDKFYFIGQKWFAVEKEDGLIERVLPVAGEYQKREFSYLLSKQAYHSISEGHLWLSIFSRPPSNKFTRVQRCTCCFVLLLTAMLLNIIYYDQMAAAKTNTNTGYSLAFGPLYITPQQISIGVIVEILTFLPSLLLIQFFRRIKSRRFDQQLSPLRQALYKIKDSPNEIAIKPIKKKQSKLMFPWWCLFIAYTLSLIIAGISIFFIIVRGIEFGDLKTQKWLTSILTGFFSSILFIQPFKVISLVIIFAFIFRNRNNDKEAEELIDDDGLQLADDEDYLHSIKNESPFTYRSHRPINRLEEFEVIWARNQRLKEIQMWAIIREIFSYFTFLALLYFLTYSNLNFNSYYQVQHLRKFFLNTKQIDNDYTKMSTNYQYWSWLNNSFTPNIRAQKWYNNEPAQNLSGYINDKTDRLIGWATMRQLRVKAQPCQSNLISQCTDDYSFSNEEKRSFDLEWANETVQLLNSSIDRAFHYRSNDELDTYVYIGNHGTYGGGGYVYEFRGPLSALQNNLTKLNQLHWIDSQTRAVIIQMSLYNPNSQLFTAVTLLSEFLPTGGIQTSSRFEPISFEIFKSTSQLICFIIYMLFIIYMMILEIQLFLKLKFKYFRNFWSIINLGIIVCSLTNIGIYVWRYRQSNYIGDLFEKTHGYVYINLQLSVYINDIYTYLLGFCCFFGTIKLIYLCRFDQRLCLLLKTLEYASKDLLSFACMFSIVYIAFILLFYFLFNSKILSCSNLFQTGEMLFEIVLMKFNAYELSQAEPFLGPFCFSLFIFIVVFICMSMFLTIINDSFRYVRDNIKRKSQDDQQILAFMWLKFQQWIGIGKTNELDRFIERDQLMRSKYIDPIEHFPDKIDELLDALNRIYMDQQSQK